MIDLDDERTIAAGDPGGMLRAIAGLGEHLRVGHAIGFGAEGLPSADGVLSIACCGMGGSAVAGEFVRSLFRQRLGVPMDVHRGALLPTYCGSHTLVVVSSYSGNTEETISCLREAISRGCRIIAISSGGGLADVVRDAGMSPVVIPADLPSPRAALGYMTGALLGALESIGVLPSLNDDVREASEELDAVAAKLAPGVPRASNPAKELAWQIGDRVPVIWGAEGFASAAASRWRTQFNENAKVSAWSSSLPELDHNEVVGWAAGQGERYFLVALRHEGEDPDVAVRFPPSIEIAVASGVVAEEIWAAGRSSLARLFSLVQMGDFASAYHGIAHGIDPTPIDAIVALKRTLEQAR